nr:MAG TPA: hypothetical protein [Bacteriophage sp.]
MMTPEQIALMMRLFSQGNIDPHMCALDYEHYGIATECDGDTKTIEELEDCEHDFGEFADDPNYDDYLVCRKCGAVKL